MILTCAHKTLVKALKHPALLAMQEEKDAERLKRIKERIQEEEEQRLKEQQSGAAADVELI